MSQHIPMSSPSLHTAEIEAVNQVLQTPCLSCGPWLDRFEECFAAYVGARYAVGVSSGTAGLHLGVIAAGISEGDLVITTPFSFVASANCILYERAIPVFVDVDPLTGNINPALVAEAAHDLTSGGAAAQRWLPPAFGNSPNGSDGSFVIHNSSFTIHNLRAILPVHAFGQPVDMDPLLELADRYGLALIEDACEAIGAEYKERKVGAWGHTAVFAFYPNKQMTTGEGGMIVTNNEAWAGLFRSLRNQGRDVFNAWLNHTRLGYNYRLNELSAALGLAQLQRIEELLAGRAQVASWYDERLANEELIERPHLASTTSRMSWFVYVVRIRPPTCRDEIMQKLAAAGIPSRPYFTPIHLQPFYRKKFGYQRGDFPVTEFLGDVSLALPFSGIMSEEQVDYVCQRLRASIRCGLVKSQG